MITIIIFQPNWQLSTSCKLIHGNVLQETHTQKKKKTRDKYKAKDLVSPVRSLLHLIRNQLNVIKRVPGV